MDQPRCQCLILVNTRDPCRFCFNCIFFHLYVCVYMFVYFSSVDGAVNPYSLPGREFQIFSIQGALKVVNGFLFFFYQFFDESNSFEGDFDKFNLIREIHERTDQRKKDGKRKRWRLESVRSRLSKGQRSSASFQCSSPPYVIFRSNASFESEIEPLRKILSFFSF